MTYRILLRTYYDLSAAGGGGAGKLMKNIATALDNNGWNVEVLCPRSQSKSSSSNNITYHRFAYDEPESSTEAILSTIRGAWKYYQLTRNTSFDVVLDDVSHYPFYPAHFLCPTETTNALFIHIAFFGAAREYLGPFRGSVIDIIDKTLPYLNEPNIVCAGPNAERRIHEKTGYNRTDILNPCIEIEKFDYRFDSDSKQIIYLGRLGIRKNVSCLLRAWAIIEQAGFEEYSLIIAGKGTQEKKLRLFADQLNLQHVEFVGYVDEKRKQQLLAESLLCVIPSKMEGYVTSGLEALASGTPIVGADTNGINDYVIDGETGYLFNTDDHNHLAKRLRSLFNNPAGIKPVARNGRDLAEDHSFEQFSYRTGRIFGRFANQGQ